MRILIADDEAPARSRLRRLLSDTADCEIVAEAASGRETLAAIEALHPDVVLLDIRMPDGDGLAVAEAAAHLAPPPAVVFVTALDDRARAALDAGAAGYLVKPVSRERLREAISRAARPTQAQLAALVDDRAAHSHLSARVGRDLRQIPLADVRYFRAEGKTTLAVLVLGEVTIESSLAALEEEFAGQFLRVRRNLLVARNAVSRLHHAGSETWIELDNGARLPVARRHRQSVAAALTERSA